MPFDHFEGYQEKIVHFLVLIPCHVTLYSRVHKTGATLIGLLLLADQQPLHVEINKLFIV